MQRAALALTVTKETTGGTGEIFVAFGVNNGSENAWNQSGKTSDLYHGWLIGYPVQSNGTFASPNPANFAFASTANFGGTADSTCTDVSSSGTGETGTSPYNNCGLGGGIWMSERGPAIYTATDTNKTNYVLIGVGNGGFETGTTYPNWGSSVVAFSVGTTCATSQTGITTVSACCQPSSSLTPYCYVGCSSTPTYPTVQYMNYLDQDMGMPGTQIVGLDGNTGGNPYVVTCDKSGQCYALNPTSLGGYQSPADCGGANCEFAGSRTSISFLLSGGEHCYGNTTSSTPCDSISEFVDCLVGSIGRVTTNKVAGAPSESVYDPKRHFNSI